MRRSSHPRLVSRFALASLVAFLAIGTSLAVLVSHQLRQREEQAATYHAVFVTESILANLIQVDDLSHPLSAQSQAYLRLRRAVAHRVLRAPVVRVKIWLPDGTVFFSDEPRLLGRRFEDEQEELGDILKGEVQAGLSDLGAEENVFERERFDKLYQAYVPLRPAGADAPMAVAEVYTDYAGIQEGIDQLFRTLIVTLLVGLGALYVLLLPIARRAARTVSTQNETLAVQAKRLQDLLDREQQRLVEEQQRVVELQELNRMKDDFVAVASHELRTPLTSIIGYAKTLRRPEFAEDTGAREEFLQAIERQGERLSRLVQNLLKAANLDERSRPSLVSVRLEDLAEELVAGLGPRAARLRVDIGADVPPVVTDRSGLELIVSNLVDNALKFSPAGTSADLRARRDGDSVVISVEDRGVGIPPEELDAVFDRFYQLDSSLTRQFGGVGLGLSLVKELARGLQGEVSVDSAVGRGSTFTIRLPLVHPASLHGNGHGNGHAADPARTHPAGGQGNHTDAVGPGGMGTQKASAHRTP